MDSHAPTPSGGGGTWWTDEKHLHFLDSLESSFLRTMLVRRSNRPVLRLDRHLPDSGDSTSDLTPPGTRKTKTTRDTYCRLDGPAAKKSRHSRPSRNHSCDDQVVPQIAKRAADEDEEDPTNVQASQARPT
ncbi:uncharacterized protein LOC115742692 [Rhodamnia argentea]|uniref:Uncharacterized protein LOC115742692 n=1 Tax=Rhodamnia argentea TaxID=178133 RepID=A0A8B8PFW9_9MYRT|nr:uncharacterized protein LOC115742692 [Rhodamnia argentea]